MSGMEDAVKEEEENEPKKEQKIQRPQDVVYVHVYRSDFTKAQPTKQDMSALVITGTGEVYGTGRNTLIGWKGKSPMPMKEDGPEVLDEYVRVKALSGLGLRKIVVGLGFGAGVTQDNLMYVWGGGPQIVSSGAVIIVKEFRPQEDCNGCKPYQRSSEHIGGAILSVCSSYSRCSKYSTYSATPTYSYSGIPVKMFASFGSVVLDCLECGTTCSSKVIDRLGSLNYCESCDILREVEGDEALLPLLTQPPLTKDSGIIDIDCGCIFLCMLSDNNHLTFWGWEAGKRNETKSEIILPEYAKVRSICCGKRYIAVVSVKGGLYCYGDNDDECFGWRSPSVVTVTLRKVNVPSPAIKVCCGDQTTVCLLDDNTIWFYLNGAAQTSSNKICMDSACKFTDIAAIHFVDEFFLQANKTSGLSVKSSISKKDSIIFNINELECNETLLKSFEPVATTERSCSLPASLAKLYGSKSLSDITFKLADGEFPAHRLVLCSTSKHFQNIFMDNDNHHEILDCTTYNPRAWRVLFQYFYQVKPDDLDLDDLLDLCSLATIYDEPTIINDVVLKLKAHITIENVQQLLAKGLSSRNQILISECKKFICSPTFRGKVVRAIMQDSNTLIKWIEGGTALIS